LLPELKEGMTLVLDNLSTHKDIKDLLIERGINVLYLPPYTTEYNPIEMMWAKIKLFLRKKWNCRRYFCYRKIFYSIRYFVA